MPSPIRIRIAEIEPLPQNERKGAKATFWYPLRSDGDFEGRSIAQLEAQLRREFGGTLSRHLKGGIRHELSEMDRAARGNEPPWYMFNFRRRQEEPYWEEAVAAFTRYLDFRQQLIADVPEYAKAIRRLSDASRVLFSVTIRDYTSLNLNLDISSIEKLAAAFESDFDSFRVFLDVFVPQTMGEVFNQDFADSFSYDIDIPQDFKNAFLSASATKPLLESTTPPVTPPLQPSISAGGYDSQKRAEWLWRLANGSLAIPVILALIVLYFGWKEMSDLRSIQRKTLESVLDHQHKLLEEDRQRLERLLQPSATSTSTTPGAGPPAPNTPSS